MFIRNSTLWHVWCIPIFIWCVCISRMYSYINSILVKFSGRLLSVFVKEWQLKDTPHMSQCGITNKHIEIMTKLKFLILDEFCSSQYMEWRESCTALSAILVESILHIFLSFHVFFIWVCSPLFCVLCAQCCRRLWIVDMIKQPYRHNIHMMCVHQQNVLVY
jgi:hypothetical protein